MTTDRTTTALLVTCLLVAGILVGISIGRAQVCDSVDSRIAHLGSAAPSAVATMQVLQAAEVC